MYTSLFMLYPTMYSSLHSIYLTAVFASNCVDQDFKKTYNDIITYKLIFYGKLPNNEMKFTSFTSTDLNKKNEAV